MHRTRHPAPNTRHPPPSPGAQHPAHSTQHRHQAPGPPLPVSQFQNLLAVLLISLSLAKAPVRDPGANYNRLELRSIRMFQCVIMVCFSPFKTTKRKALENK